MELDRRVPMNKTYKKKHQKIGPVFVDLSPDTFPRKSEAQIQRKGSFHSVRIRESFRNPK